jgi:hypothetical protein
MGELRALLISRTWSSCRTIGRRTRSSPPTISRTGRKSGARLATRSRLEHSRGIPGREGRARHQRRQLIGNNPRTGKTSGDCRTETSRSSLPPLVASDRIVVTGGTPTGAQTTFAIRPGARGDAQSHVLWAAKGPLLYPDPVASTDPHVSWTTAFFRRTTSAAGRADLPDSARGGSGVLGFSDCLGWERIYLPSEDGALRGEGGRDFESLAKNEMGATMASPAVSEGRCSSGKPALVRDQGSMTTDDLVSRRSHAHPRGDGDQAVVR